MAVMANPGPKIVVQRYSETLDEYLKYMIANSAAMEKLSFVGLGGLVIIIQ